MAGHSPPSEAYQFGEFILEPAQQRLSGAGNRPIALTPKAFDTLWYLVERSGQLVTKSELLERVWPNVVVEEAILARNVADLRKALGDDSNAPRYIETLPKRGYRFIARVAIAEATGVRSAPTPGANSARPVDTLQLVAESPVKRATENTLEAPEFDRKRLSMRGALPWLMAALAVGAALAWWHWR
jgi:DNA-binding winged helix-turn-helix (wHTH) protein